MLLSLSLSVWFHVGGRIKCGRGPERQFAKAVRSPGSRRPKSSWENNTLTYSNENMLGAHYVTTCARRCME